MTVPDYVRLARHESDLDDNGDDAAANVTYDPTVSGLSATDVQAAIDALSPGGGAGVMPWFDVTAYGAVHNGTTDDTAAIQAAIDACMTAGGGTVFFPNGVYQIDGALVDTSHYNSQLKIPRNVYSSTQPAVAIRLLGMGPNVPQSESNQGTTAVSTGGAVLRSSWNGTISGHPAIISAGDWGAIAGSTGWNFVFVTLENIEFKAHADPKLTAIQMQAAFGLRCLNVTLGTNVNSAGKALPTHSNAVGIDMPFGLNSQEPDTLNGVTIENFYTGLVPSEQANGEVSFGQCVEAIRFVGGQGTPTYTRHANHFSKVLIYQCTHGLVFTTDIRWVVIDLLNIEHDASPFAAIYDIDDASNYARGFIGWHTTDYTTGPEDNLLMNGGTGLSLFGAHVKRWKLNNVVDIPTGTNPSTNPATGRRIYTDSATGGLKGRTPAGTVIDYEAGGASAGTPALTLGTTNATGSASTFVATDATIAEFDATAPTTSAIGDAAAAGSAGKAARRDHTHGREALSTATPLVEASAGAVGTGVKSSREDHVHPAATATGAGLNDHIHIVSEAFTSDGVATSFLLANEAVPGTVAAYDAGGVRKAVTLGGMNDQITYGAAPAAGTCLVDYVPLQA